MCIYHILCIHLFIDGHLVCSHFLAVMNNAVRNMGIQIPVQVPASHLLGTYSERELLDHMVILCLSFSGTTIQFFFFFFYSGCTFLLSHQQTVSRVLFSPQSHQYLFSVCFLFLFFGLFFKIVVFLMDVVFLMWYFIVVLICISLMISDVEHVFHVLVTHLYIFFF